jgi:hypothetical protein
MSTYTEITDSIGEQLAESVQTAEEQTKALISNVGDLASNVVSSVRSFRAKSNLPSISDVVAANTSLAERVLNAQKDLAVRVLDRLPTWNDNGAPAKKSAGAKN